MIRFPVSTFSVFLGQFFQRSLITSRSNQKFPSQRWTTNYFAPLPSPPFARLWRSAICDVTKGTDNLVLIGNDTSTIKGLAPPPKTSLFLSTCRQKVQGRALVLTEGCQHRAKYAVNPPNVISSLCVCSVMPATPQLTFMHLVQKKNKPTPVGLCPSRCR